MKSTAVSVFVISVLLRISVGEEFCEEYTAYTCEDSVNWDKDQISITAVECGNTTAKIRWEWKNDVLEEVNLDYICYDINGTKLSNDYILKRSEGPSGSIDFNVNGVRCVFGGCVNGGYPVDYCWYTFTDTATCEDECSTNNGGCSHTCTDTNESYNCSCRTGYILADDDHGCNDINECINNTSDCEQQCNNTIGSYYCTCREGYNLGSDNHSCLDIDECDNVTDCEQQCINTNGSYYCACWEGYDLDEDNYSCLDVDECVNDTSDCEQLCHNTTGSYYCTCSEGYVLHEDNYSCADTDECDNENAGCKQECVNTIGSYYCNCSEGYDLDEDNHNCLDINECDTDNGGCSHNCSNVDGGYYCECLTGYDVDDVDDHECEDIDECDLGICEQQCNNTNGSYYCTCREGYYLGNDNRSCFAVSNPDRIIIIVLITVLPLFAILVCVMSGTGLLAAILKRKKRSDKENELFHLYELEPSSYFQKGNLLKIKSFDEISVTESLITIIHPLELTSATHFMIDRNPREDKDDTIKRKSSSDAISQMSEVSKTSEEDSIEVEGLNDRHDSTLEDSTATNRTVYNSFNTKESTQFTNNFPLVCSEYTQDSTIQSQFPVLSDEFMETESFHDSTDTIHLQTLVDSSVAIGPSPQHSSSTDEHVSCNDRESKEKFQHASYNLTTVDVNSDYIDRFTQWKLPLNSTTSSSGYNTDDSGYLQSSSVTNYSDTDEMSQPRNSMYMLGKYFDHSSNIALDLNDDFYTETNEMEFETSCSDGYIRNN